MWKKVVVLLAVGILTNPSLAKSRRVVSNDQGEKIKVEQSHRDKSVKEVDHQSSPHKKRLSEKTVSSEQRKESTVTEHLWSKGQDTVVKLKGQASDSSAHCQTFKIHLAQELTYQINCVGNEMSATLNLKSSSQQTVTQKGEHITITRYNYLTKKPQVSRLEQSTLRVPFVEQIIHIKKSEDGRLAFYFESFREDEFGRIVQDGFIQAHSLTKKKLKISAN